MSGVLGTAEHFLTAVYSLLKDKGEEEFDSHKYLLLLVEKPSSVAIYSDG